MWKRQLETSQEAHTGSSAEEFAWYLQNDFFHLWKLIKHLHQSGTRSLSSIENNLAGKFFQEPFRQSGEDGVANIRPFYDIHRDSRSC